MDAVDEALWTPLLCAASAGKLDVVERLVRANATVNAQNEQGSTCLCVSLSCV